MKKLLADTYKTLLGRAEMLISGLKYSNDEVVVLCMHSTPADRLRDFEFICDYLLRFFKPFRADDMERWFKGEMKQGPYLLFTFDDGLKNNLGAAKILEKKGLTAYFFLVPEFVAAIDGKAYYLKNIRQVIDESYDHEPEDFLPLSKEEIKTLLASGHRIGSHTKSHLMRNTMDMEQLVSEVVESKNWLEQFLEIEVDAFCSPINTSISVDARSKELIKKNYRYHFTTFPGLNAQYRDPHMICRRNIEANWSVGKINFALGRWDLRRWQAGIEQHRSL